MRILAISGSLRRDSHNTMLLRAAARAARARGHPGALGGAARGAAVRPGRRRRAGPRGRRWPPGRGRVGRRRPDRDARVQPLDPRHPQERARLGLAPVRDERVPQQARRGDRLEHRHVRGGLGAGRAPQGARRDGRPGRRRRGRGRPSRRRSSTRAGTWSTRRFASSFARRSRPSRPRPSPSWSRPSGLVSLSASGGGSSSASRRCTDERESTPTSFPWSTTGTRSKSRSSRKAKASISGMSESIVAFGASAISRSGGRPRVEPARDDLADERLARDHADEVAAVADEHGAHLRPHQRLARLLRGRRRLERVRRRDHRVADALLLVAAHG